MIVTDGGLVNVTEGRLALCLVIVTEGGLVNVTDWQPVGWPHLVEGVHHVDLVCAELFCLQLE